jgi:hypothetical protein
MVWHILALFLCLMGIGWGAFGEEGSGCPHLCPGECTVLPALWLEERHPELGTLKKRCIQAECPLTPWCFEVYSVFYLPFLPLPPVERLLTQLLVSTDGPYLTGPGIYASVEGGKATVCVDSAYEFPIPVGDSVFKLPVGSIRGVVCMGKCPCSGFLWMKPFVVVTSKATGSRVRKVFVEVTDPDEDVVCVGHDIISGRVEPQLTLAPSGPVLAAFYTTGSCVDSFDIVVPCTEQHVLVKGWAKDLKGLEDSDVLDVVGGNRPPQVRGELQGEATVTLYPDRVQVSPVVLRGEVFDPDGDPVFVEAPGIPPQFASFDTPVFPSPFLYRRSWI